MNRKKPVLVTTLSLAGLLSAGAAMAQGQGPRPDRHRLHGPPTAEQQLAHLERALDLTDAQSLQLLEVLQTAQAEREALHERIMESLGPEICALQQSTDAEILAILTPEKAAAWEERRQERAGRGVGHHGPPRPDCPTVDG